MEVQIVRMRHYAEAMTEPRLFRLARQLADRRSNTADRRAEARGERYGIFAIGKHNRESLEGALIIEEDSGYSPLEDDFPLEIEYLRKELAADSRAKIFFVGKLSTESEASIHQKIAGQIIISTCELLMELRAPVAVIAVNPEKHQEFYEAIGFQAIAYTDCMSGMTDAPGVFMVIKPGMLKYERVMRMKKRFFTDL